MIGISLGVANFLIAREVAAPSQTGDTFQVVSLIETLTPTLARNELPYTFSASTNEAVDVGGWWSTGANRERLTAPAEAVGRFVRVCGGIRWSSSSLDAICSVQWRNSAGTLKGQYKTQKLQNANVSRLGAAGTFGPVVSGDYFTMVAGYAGGPASLLLEEAYVVAHTVGGPIA